MHYRQAILLLAALGTALVVSGCGDWSRARYNRSHGTLSWQDLSTACPFLAEVTSEWRVEVDYTAARLPGASALAGFPLGNGEVFAATGLRYPLGTLENIFAPTYQKTQGSYGQIVPLLFVGSQSTQWQRQEMTWVRPGGIVRTISSTAEGLTLTAYDLVPPSHRALVRFMVLTNHREKGRTGPLSLGHIFTAAAPEYAENEIRLSVGQFGLRAGYLDSRAVVTENVSPPFDPVRASRATSPMIPEGAPCLRCPVGRLRPGESLVKIFYLIFTGPGDDGSQALQAVRTAVQLLEQQHQHWAQKEAGAPPVQTGDRRLDDLLEIERYLVRVQQAQAGGFSPMHGYTKCWIRDSNGPVRYLLACGDYEAVRKYLEYQFRGYAQQGKVSNNLPLDLSLTAAVTQPDWETVPVPGAEIASFIILQRYWYWKHTADNDLLRAQWPMLRRCLQGQKVDERGTLPFFGDETYRFPGYEMFAQGRPAPDYVNMGLRSLDSAMEYVVAAQGLAEMAQALGRFGEAAEYRAAAERVRWATEQYYWQADRGLYAPAMSDLTEELQQNPFAPINLHSWWLDYPGDPARQQSNLEAVLRYLAKPGGTLLTTPEFGYYVPMTPGYLVYALSKAGHPAREQALQGLLAAAEASGGYAEMNTPEDRPSEEVWGQHRFRPWEGGINAEAAWYALTGFEPDMPARRVRLSPWLPSGASPLKAVAKAGSARFDLEFSPRRCVLVRRAAGSDRAQAPERADIIEAALRFLTSGPAPQVSGNWREAGGRLEIREDAYGQKVLLLTGLRLAEGGRVEITFDPPLQPLRASMPKREPFVWEPPPGARLRPIVLLTWDAQTVAEQRAKHGSELAVVDTKISWPAAYLRSWLFGPDGRRRARLVILDVAGFPGAFKRADYWTEGEGGKVLAEFQNKGGQVERLQTGRILQQEVPDI